MLFSAPSGEKQGFLFSRWLCRHQRDGRCTRRRRAGRSARHARTTSTWTCVRAPFSLSSSLAHLPLSCAPPRRELARGGPPHELEPRALLGTGSSLAVSPAAGSALRVLDDDEAKDDDDYDDDDGSARQALDAAAAATTAELAGELPRLGHAAKREREALAARKLAAVTSPFHSKRFYHKAPSIGLQAHPRRRFISIDDKAVFQGFRQILFPDLTKKQQEAAMVKRGNGSITDAVFAPPQAREGEARMAIFMTDGVSMSTGFDSIEAASARSAARGRRVSVADKARRGSGGRRGSSGSSGNSGSSASSSRRGSLTGYSSGASDVGGKAAQPPPPPPSPLLTRRPACLLSLIHI
jgi:hypothetical protein